MSRFHTLFNSVTAVALAVEIALAFRAGQVQRGREAPQASEGRLQRELATFRNLRERERRLRMELDTASRAVAKSASPQPAPAPSLSLAARLAQAMKKPEFQKLLAARQAAIARARYRKLFEDLKLAPETTDKLVRLIAQKQWANTPSADLSPAASAAERSRIDSDIQTLLGNSGYATYVHFEATLPIRTALLQLQDDLSFAEQPLSAAATENLIDLWYAASPQTKSDATGGDVLTGAGLSSDFGDRQRIPIPRSLDGVEAWPLSPAQRVAVRNFLAEQAAWDQVRALGRAQAQTAATN